MLVLHPKTQQATEKVIAHPPHALLLVAPEGSGKVSLARHIAAKLLDSTDTKLEASTCYFQVEPIEKAIGVEAIRDLRHFLVLKSHASSSEHAITRVAVVADAHCMSREAQNALLKTLEEPPEGTLLVLAASSKQSLLPTIISRCQVLTLQKPSPEQIHAAIPAGNSHDGVTLALRISDGWPGLALAILNQGGDHPLAIATEQSRMLLQASPLERLSKVDSLVKQREQAEAVCYILEQMAHVAMQSSTASTLERWRRVLQAAYQCREALRSRANAKLAVTQLMLSL